MAGSGPYKSVRFDLTAEHRPLLSAELYLPPLGPEARHLRRPPRAKTTEQISHRNRDSRRPIKDCYGTPAPPPDVFSPRLPWRTAKETGVAETTEFELGLLSQLAKGAPPTKSENANHPMIVKGESIHDLLPSGTRPQETIEGCHTLKDPMCGEGRGRLEGSTQTATEGRPLDSSPFPQGTDQATADHIAPGLWLAVTVGNTHMVKMLIDAGVDINAAHHGRSAFSIAAEDQNKDIFNLLYLAGADPLQGDPDGAILAFAAINGYVELVAGLIALGVNVNAYRYAGGITVLMIAAAYGHQDIVHALIRHGIELNVTDFQGLTALSWAAARGHFEMVKLLLRCGVDETIGQGSQASPLVLARQYGHILIQRILETAKFQPEAGLGGKSWKGKPARPSYRLWPALLQQFNTYLLEGEPIFQESSDSPIKRKDTTPSVGASNDAIVIQINPDRNLGVERDKHALQVSPQRGQFYLETARTLARRAMKMTFPAKNQFDDPDCEIVVRPRRTLWDTFGDYIERRSATPLSWNPGFRSPRRSFAFIPTAVALANLERGLWGRQLHGHSPRLHPVQIVKCPPSAIPVHIMAHRSPLREALTKSHSVSGATESRDIFTMAGAAPERVTGIDANRPDEMSRQVATGDLASPGGPERGAEASASVDTGIVGLAPSSEPCTMATGSYSMTPHEPPILEPGQDISVQPSTTSTTPSALAIPPIQRSEETWLMVCIQEVRVGLHGIGTHNTLHQIRCHSQMTDKELISNLRSRWFDQTKPTVWFSWTQVFFNPWRLAHIYFVGFTIDNEGYIDVQVTQPSLPPLDDPDYTFFVAPRNPPIGDDKFMNMFNKQTLPSGKSNLDVIPKRRERLDVSPLGNSEGNMASVPFQWQTGWGIHMVQGLSVAGVCLYVIYWVAFSIVLWQVLIKTKVMNVDQASGLLAAMVALPALLIPVWRKF